MCMERNVDTMPDKYFKRKVNEFKVYCPNKSLGCEWVGELGELGRHVSIEGECQFAKVACPYSCGDGFKRCQLEGHKANDCPNRPFTCQYCGHNATYITVTRDHWPICTKHPVDCPNKSLSCQWAGERGDLDQHLNDGSEEGECEFVTVACPYDCGGGFQQRQLTKHKAEDCFIRPFTCRYCNYKATYVEVTNAHWDICQKYPMECPNKCGETVIERQFLTKHLEETCPLQVIKCEFSYAGCEVEHQRQHMQVHLKEDIQSHLIKVSQCTITLLNKTEQQQSVIDQQQSIIAQLDNVTEQQQKQIVALTYLHVNVHKPHAFITPPDIVMTEFEKHKKARDRWHSPPFYSHIGGYKMCLLVVASDDSYGKGRHVSVFCVLEHGEYDGQLKWPFRGDIVIQLLNQSSNKGHYERTVTFDDRAGDNVAGRVLGKDRAAGWGYHEFIAHTDLNAENTEYLKNDCLKFKISNVVIKST